jgi:Mg2+ and Co2+ transporter CorA
MNVRYPGSDTEWGFWVSLAVMALTALGMVVFFRSRRWL